MTKHLKIGGEGDGQGADAQDEDPKVPDGDKDGGEGAANGGDEEKKHKKREGKKRAKPAGEEQDEAPVGTTAKVNLCDLGSIICYVY